ncbi:C45 family autoproteolytic acyltransferase/hydolase [Micromonospora sonneratiae]|uniref:C45 family autoproteolytic acyltransferase/hydrolase n=1 Tax=Micromonospora sonneratiae TaxID=1184706 RepID=A0ABW3YKZ2_9ACTN
MISVTEKTADDLPVPLIQVRGEPGECGTRYGVAARELIAANLTLYLRRFRDQAGLGESEVHSCGEAFRRSTRSRLPRIAQMLDGVAAGADVPVAEIYALNGRTELLYGTRRTESAYGTQRPEGDVGRPDGDAGPRALDVGRADGGDGACTSIGVLGTHTANGHLLLGQNWDWHPDQRQAMVLLATRDETGHTVLTLTEAGMLAKTGLNSAQVGVCVNMLGCDRDGLPGDGSESGVPYHVLLRAALEADTLTGALRSVCRAPRNSSINLLIGQAAEAGGELIDLELVPGDVGWLNPVDGLITHANHLETPLPVHDTMKDWGGSTFFRSARVRRLLAAPAAQRTITEDDLATALRDHASFPHSICRHVDERDAPLDRSETVYSVLLDVAAGRFGLAVGPTCRHDYDWLTLDVT